MRISTIRRAVLAKVDSVSPTLLPRRLRLARLSSHRKALQAAQRQGALETQVRRAELVLHYDPHDEWAANTAAFARDALALRDSGLDLPECAPTTPYERSAHSVVSVLSQSLPHRSGGYATRSHGVLTALHRRGWDVAAITRLGFPYIRWPVDDPRTVSHSDTIDGITYLRALDDRRRYPQHPLQAYVHEFAEHVERAAVERRASLIHASSFYQTALAGAVAARRLGIPFVYEMRGLEDLMRSAENKSFASSPAHDFLVQMELEVCLAADAVLVITEALKTEMVRRGVPQDRISVLPNGVHVADFDPKQRDEDLARELGLEDQTVIGYAGSLVHYEGLDLLVDAAAELRQRRGDDFAVVIVGDGAARPAIERKVHRGGMDDLVRFTGRVQHDEVSRYLSLFDITPFPRKRLDVCELISPMKPYEAMAAGRAVAVSDVAALTEIVAHDTTGLVFQANSSRSLADTLDRLIGDPALRKRLGGAAREWVLRHGDWSQVSTVVDDVYGSLGLEKPVSPPDPMAGDPGAEP